MRERGLRVPTAVIKKSQQVLTHVLGAKLAVKPSGPLSLAIISFAEQRFPAETRE